ncbi:MAG TPA: polysaccharide deacetylase family protein [Gaiellales bacterium]|jgi:peptidoglycan/xylan/chitin deacetylase (PgdA/CDA1 family)
MSRPRIALTFDTEHWSHPSAADVQDRILDVLEGAGVRATFFLQGRWATAYPDCARRIAAAGHLVGNHSHHHAPMDALTDAGIEGDVRKAEAAIRELAGVDPRPWFRCPFGYGHDDPRVLAALERAGYRNQHWDVEPDDWRPERTPADLARLVIDGALAHGDGAVVLLHSWPPATIAALPAILIGLREGGARLVRLDEVAA